MRTAFDKASLPFAMSNNFVQKCISLQPMETRFKVVLIGDSSVGKTSIAKRMASDTFDQSSQPTIGSTNFEIRRTVGDTEVIIDLWDTAGQEKFRSLAPMYFQRSQAAILVYDITSKRTLSELNTFLIMLREKADENCLIYLIGNKYDLVSQRDITIEDLDKFSQDISAKYASETSALTGYGIETLVEIMAEDLSKMHIVAEKELVVAQKKNCC